MKSDEKDTIAAISTPVGFGGIGIVRLSGEESLDIARKIFRKALEKGGMPKKAAEEPDTRDFVPRRLYRGYIVEPERQTVLDEVLMAYMPSPNSYTCEDVIEIQAHGGTAALKAILELVIGCGARLAEAGEFTKRAYLNGRIDLAQAEATIDVIQAKTDASLKIANRNLEGNVGNSAREIQNSLLDLKAILEAHIDFPEDVDEKLDLKAIKEQIFRNILKPIGEILDGYTHGQLLREGVRVVILGKTNVGKSSLLNQFLKRDRAIVTSIPGTTRDTIEESLDLYGLPLVIVDTAGWRKTNDPVEEIGVERSRASAETADLILFMVDGAAGVDTVDETLVSKIERKEKFLIINKSDMLNGQNSVKIPEHWNFKEMQYTSAKYGHGIDELKKRLYEKLMGNGCTSEMEVVPNLRQKNLFSRAQQAIETATAGIEEGAPPELVAIDIQEAMGALAEITGEKVQPDILDEIFSRFCIGK